jgi:RNA polymerase-binding transcription factor
MAAAKWGRFKRALEAEQQTAILDLCGNREIIAVVRSADEMDEMGRAAEREFAILCLNRKSELLRKIKAALRRIEDGTFGTCIYCQETIGLNRLTAVPWTPSCIRCQEAMDRGEAAILEPVYQRDVDAA